MDLRTKLARLKRPETHAAAEPAEPSVLPTGPAHIEVLRAQLAEMLDRSRARDERQREERRVAIEARLAASPLPFDEHETRLGPLHVRELRHPPHAHVGRVPLAYGRDARGDAMALLALDASLASLDIGRALYLDTEATGLAGGTGTVPFLIGLAWFEGDELVVEQLLLRRLGEEGPILARVANRIAAASMLVSFNGKAFDMPLLRTRYVMNRMPVPIEPPHLDLVHVARRIHRSARGSTKAPASPTHPGPFVERWDEEADALKRPTSCKLVALERQILGFVRVDDVASSEVPARYAHFLRTGDADAVLSVCDHNAWDVVSMAALVGVYSGAVCALEGTERSDALPRNEVPLAPRDMVGLATTLRRAGDLPRARRAADAAVASADAPHDDELDQLARRARGVIAKVARDLQTALGDFEHLAGAHDDPAARLELCKLYEHRLKDPARALEHATAGTTEDEGAAAHRVARLERKAERVRQLELVPAKPARKRKSPGA